MPRILIAGYHHETITFGAQPGKLDRIHARRLVPSIRAWAAKMISILF